MESTQRRCAEKGCERHPQPGWTRCEAHVEEWVTRLFAVAVPHRPEEFPRYVPTKADELELRALAGDR